jgi:hypothetical protein
MIKEIMARAYGKPVATQEENKVASGLIVLPMLSTGPDMFICPVCGYEATKGMEGGKYADPKNTVEAEPGPADSVPGLDGA